MSASQGLLVLIVVWILGIGPAALIAGFVRGFMPEKVEKDTAMIAAGFWPITLVMAPFVGAYRFGIACRLRRTRREGAKRAPGEFPKARIVK